MTYAKIIHFCPPPPAPVTENTAQLYALLFYLRYPSMVEGYGDANDDPNEVDGPSNISDEMDARNSRPLPY